MRILAIVSVAVLSMMLGVLATNTTSYGATITVNSASDAADGNVSDGVCDTGTAPTLTGICTLRAAIETADQTPLVQTTIDFNIAGSGTQTIILGSPLDLVLAPVIIDGYSQPGSAVNTLGMNQGTNAVLAIELDASLAGGQPAALTLEGGNSTVRGLVINDMFNCVTGQPICNGIELRNAGEDTIQGNFIGTNVAGMVTNPDGVGCTGDEYGNLGNGVYVNNIPNNLIGGSTPDAVNLISGNGRSCSGSNADGIEVFGTSATGNTIKGNFIGTNAAGSTNTTGPTTLGNQADGIFLNGASGTTIGGLTLPERNVIAGNSGGGIGQSGASGTLIEGNIIGLDAAGTKDRGNNGDGINITGGANDTIGGTSAGAGNVIANNGNGVAISGVTATGNVIQGNYVGTNITGTAALANGFDGVNINGAPGNTIGGTTAAARNIISGNFGKGVSIVSSGATGNLVEGNYIGTTASGAAALGNNNDGVYLNVGGNTVGGATASARNIISGNLKHGIEINGTTTAANTIQGNYIGTDLTGAARLPNGSTILHAGDGILISNASNTIIGGTGTAGNLVSGNLYKGIEISGSIAGGTQVTGNFIGTDNTGGVALGNGQDGIYINGAKNTIIGGTAPGTRNVISGNGFLFVATGVTVLQNSATGTQIIGNMIGANLAGTAAVGNSGDGVYIAAAPGVVVGGSTAAARNLISGNGGRGIQIASGASGNLVEGDYIGGNGAGSASMGNGGDGVYIFAAPNNTIGGTSASARNIISGNGAAGVDLLDTGATGNLVEGNYIGTDVTGSADVGNAGYGVYLNGAPSNTIGGTTGGSGNVISGNNGGAGLYISSLGATGNLIEGNRIGTNAAGTSALANSFDGVRVDGGSNNSIGGSAAGASNTIEFNGGNGVIIGSGTGNKIDSNSIDSNASLGIELGNDGVTPNDPGDGDTGPNNLQNYPVLSSASSTGGSTLIGGSLNSTASTTFRLQFFAGPTCDPSGNGEGRTLVGSSNATTDGSGNVSFSASFPVSVLGGWVITSTATDPSANTSEFSGCVALPGSTDADGDGVPDSIDNCPNWYNPAQNLPPWPVPSNDPDCDGFTSAIETFVGTNPLAHCGSNAWPPDFNSDQKVDIVDVVLVKPHFNTTAPNPAYGARFDLNGDNSVNIVDVVKLIPFFQRSCT